jgi:hypothetical protein
VDGAPAVAGAPSRTLSSRGASPSCIVRSSAGWATALERWRGRQGARVRLRDRRAERALQHARASHVRQLATNDARPAGEQASTVTSARDVDGDNRTAVTIFTGKRSTTDNQIARLRFTEPFSGLTILLKKKGQSANRDSCTPKNMRSRAGGVRRTDTEPELEFGRPEFGLVWANSHRALTQQRSSCV